MFVILLVLSSVLLFFYSWLNKKPKGFPPGPPCLPIVGAGPFISGVNFHFLMSKWNKQYGSVVGLVLGSQPVIAAVDAKAVLEALRHDDLQGRPNILSVRERTFNELLGPPCLPVVGSAPFISGNNFQFLMTKWRKQYGAVVGLVLGSQPAIAVVDPKAVFEVLRHEDCQGRPNTLRFKERCFGELLGVFFTDGQYWVEQRRFTLRHLKEFGFGKKSMEGLILEEAEQVLIDFKAYKSKPIQVSMFFAVSIVNILWAVMSGQRYERDDAEFQDLLEKLNRVFRSGNPSGGGIENILPPLRYLLPKWRQTQKDQADVHEFMRKAIREHEKTFDSDNMRDFIDVYIREMQNGTIDSTFTEKSLICVCSDLFSAGAESVSNSLGFCLMYMVHYPEVQMAVQAELDAVVGRNKRPSLDDKPNLPYVEATLLEVMRLNPIAPITPPHRATKDTTFRGYHVPKNTMIFINLWSCFQDVDHWGDPEVFRPERFIGSDGKVIRDEYMINFGLGKRVCLGESLARNSLFLFFATIMQELSFSLPKGHGLPSTVPLSGFTVAPAPFEVIATERL